LDSGAYSKNRFERNGYKEKMRGREPLLTGKGTPPHGKKGAFGPKWDHQGEKSESKTAKEPRN